MDHNSNVATVRSSVSHWVDGMTLQIIILEMSVDSVVALLPHVVHEEICK